MKIDITRLVKRVIKHRDIKKSRRNVEEDYDYDSACGGNYSARFRSSYYSSCGGSNSGRC